MPSIRSGRLLRPVQVWWTSSLSPAAASPVLPPRRPVVRVLRRPPQPPRVVSTRTRLNTGGNGGSPPPVGSSRSPVLIIRGRGPRRWPPPQVLRPRLASTPNLPRPPARPWPALVAPDPRSLLRPRAIVVRARPSNVPVPPTNHARPWPPVVAPDPWRSHRYAVAALKIGLGTRAVQYPRPPVVVRVPVPPRRPTVTIQADSGAGIQPRLPGRPVIRPPWRPVPRPRLPDRFHAVGLATALLLPRMRPPRVLATRRPVPAGRPPVVVRIGAFKGSGYHQARPVPPLVVPRPRAPIPPGRMIGPAPRHRLASPPRHDPPSLILVARRPPGPIPPARFVRTWPNQPIPAVNPPVPTPTPTPGPTPTPTPTPGLPPDLVAACIAWLRLRPAIVAALGDSAVASKLFSDIEPRGVAPPYLGFSEPEEDEGYETADATGLASTLSAGTLWLELVCPQSLGKLGTRQLAEQVIAALNDAPLTFADGVLVYLRRTERRFPVSRESGVGTNVVVWKRICEFKYMIERWAPTY